MTSYRRACVCVTMYTRHTHTHTHTNWNTHARHRTRVRHTLTPLGSFDFFTADFFPLTTRIPHFSPHFFHRFLLHPLPFHLLFPPFLSFSFPLVTSTNATTNLRLLLFLLVPIPRFISNRSSTLTNVIPYLSWNYFICL